MFKMLLASTALTALVTTSAFAQSATTTTDTGAATKTNETVTSADSDVAVSNPTLASDLIGSAVYESSAEDAKSIGDINDLVVSPEGEISTVVIGVGGFLGIGQKDVEVDYGTIEWADRDGQRWLIANMTREQLEAAPAFDRDAVYTEAQSEPAAVDTTMNNTTTMNNMATGTDQTGEDATQERVENGASAVETAEQKTEQTMGIDRSAMTPVMTDELSADNLMGRTVYSANDENIGEVSDVLLTSDNAVEGFVLDVGGFLGMGEKQVAISPENLEIMANADGELTIFTPFTKEQLEAQKEYSKEDWDAERDSIILVVPAG
ncbi:MAG: PRC-barrel domain-containing protein [Alphaproteobacteria bacterium]|nr:PRC-barrel domain-containing protein [Alphaproteobacteria bacterium]